MNQQGQFVNLLLVRKLKAMTNVFLTRLMIIFPVYFAILHEKRFSLYRMSLLN